MGVGEQPAMVNGSQRATNGHAVSTSGSVGRPLQDVRRQLISIAERLEDNLDPHAKPLVAEASRVLRQQSCHIAVIGQIKAGKSSFLNAFTQQPGLLPTDVNPWTAVVTRLHFRNDEPLPEHTAVFHLFSRDEWTRLAEGGGRLRELTERLVPGFEPELLRAQLEVMRQRAEGRLGKHLPELLGEVHRYKQASPDLLEAYVSAGVYTPDQTADPNKLHYSDITRTAELYFDRGPFAFPVTLVDTPGVNDPFLVRDEITRRSLDHSDLYIFVISALQPLAQTDISLLRILNGLHKDRIVVFVNRIDQLRNPMEEAPLVKANVEAKLQREFPALDIPVIVGSAWWGGLSQIAGQRDVGRMLSPGAIAYLRQYGLPDSVQPGGGQNLSAGDRTRLQHALMAASGIPHTAASVTELLRGASAAVLLRQLVSCFLELAKSAEVSAKVELESIRNIMETRRAEAEAQAESLRKERDSLSMLDGPIKQIQQSFVLIEQQLNQISEAGLSRMRKELTEIVQSFARAEANRLAGAMHRREHDGTWTTDLTRLREDLERHYFYAFRAIEAQLIEIERVLYPQLRSIIEAIIPGHGIEIGEEFASQPERIPAISALQDTLVLDLDLPWWKAWFSRRPDPRECAMDLIQFVEEDFIPVAEEMVSTSEEKFKGRISRTLKQAEAVSTGMLTTMQSRRQRVVEDYENFRNSTQGDGGIGFDQEQRNNAEAVERRRQACAKLSEELRVLQTLCQETLAVEVQEV